MKIQMYRVTKEWWHQQGVPDPHWNVVLLNLFGNMTVVIDQDCMSRNWEEAKAMAQTLWDKYNAC